MALGNLVVKLGFDGKEFISGINESTRSLNNFGKQSRLFINAAGKIGVAAAAAGAALISGIVKSGMEAIGANEDLTKALGTTYDSLRGLQIAASETGLEGLEGSLIRLNRRLGAAERGAGAAAHVAKTLNLNFRELAEMPIDERVATIADAIRDSGMSMQAAARAAQDLGFEQRQAAEFFLQGGDAIREGTKAVEEYGLSLSEIDVAKVAQASDAIGRIGRTFEAVRNQITVALAPYIEVLATRFNEVSKATRGFRDETRTAINFTIRAIGNTINAMDGFKRTMQLLVESSKVGWNAVRLGALQAAEAIVNWPTRATNDLIALLNMVPGIDITPRGVSDLGARLGAGVAEAETAIREGLRRMHEIASEPLAGEGVLQYLKDVEAAAEASAANIVKTHQAGMELLGTFPEGLPGAGGGATGETAEEKQQRLDDELQRLREFVMSEAEIEIMRHEERMERLREQLEEENLLNEEFTILREQLEEEHMERLRQLRERGMKGLTDETKKGTREQVSEVIDGINQTVGAMQSGSQKQFGIAKALSVAVAVMKGWEAAQSAWAAGMRSGGPHVAAAYTAASLAKTGAQLASLRSTSLGGGSSSGSASGAAGDGGAAAAEAQAQARQGPTTTIHLTGDSFGQKQVRALLAELNESIRDGGRFAVA